MDENKLIKMLLELAKNIRKIGDDIGKEGVQILKENPAREDIARQKAGDAGVLFIVAEQIEQAIMKYGSAPTPPQPAKRR